MNTLQRIIFNIFHPEFIELEPGGFWSQRYPPTKSLKRAAELFNSINGKVIVEIGSGIHGELSGNSTIVWTRETKAERIIAIDLEQKRLDEVTEATKGYTNVETILTDGIQYVKDFDGKIDLLYLDFWIDDAADALPGTARSESYLQAYRNAKDKMNTSSMILIDDTDHTLPYKHSLLIPEARKDGFTVLWVGRQTLLKR